MDGEYLPRTCTIVDGRKEHEPVLLSDFRDRDAYVLLGAPGAGKTEAFKHEARRAGGRRVTARDFLTFVDRPEWHETTLYIDGLDESRAGSSDQGVRDPRTAIDEIRAKLDQLGRPRFRLSCREADWFGANDRSNLEMAAPGGRIDVLRLDPLTERDARILLGQLGVEDPEAFMAEARARGLHGLMGNPQALDLLRRSVRHGGAWPATRIETFELSCAELAKEHNREHQLARGDPVSTPDVLDAAGQLCAVWLLSGAAGYSENENADGLLPLTRFHKPSQSILRHVCRTSLFETRDLAIEPRHRHIAEFLGGRHLARLIDAGLPVGRVLALLTGFDGGVVSELRGLTAWWAAHDPHARPEIVQRDPLGVVLYGDVKGFSVGEKEAVIDGLERVAGQDPSSLTRFRETDVRWGDLATEDMAETFRERLSAEDSSDARRAVQIALLESLTRGSRIPGITPLLRETVADPRRPLAIREMALDAYLAQNQDEKEQVALLAAIRAGHVQDPNDRMLTDLLQHLYPDALSPVQLAAYFREPKDDNAGWLTNFWLIHVPRKSKGQRLVRLMDALTASGKLRKVAERGESAHYLIRNIPSRLLWELLQRDTPDVDRLFEWLGYVDPFEYVDEGERIRGWFGEHPESFKGVFRVSVEREPHPFPLHSVGQLLMVWIGVPADFGEWCLAEANAATDPEVALRFATMASAHLGSTPDWNDVDQRLNGRPELAAVVKQRWKNRDLDSASIQSAGGENEKRQRQRQAWHDVVGAHRQALDANQAPPQLLRDLAHVYFGLFQDVEGTCPRDRLLGLLQDEELVDCVLRALASTTSRDDLPTYKEILRPAATGFTHDLSLPFLVGVQERHGLVDEASLRLGLAILFNDAVPAEDPAWYGNLVEEKPELVAEVLIKSARQAFRGSRDDTAELFRLTTADHDAVADHALLPVLKAFPTRSTSKRLPLLATLLGVGLVRQPAELARLARAKLRSKSMDIAQRMYWLCAGLLTGSAAFVDQLGAALNEGGGRRVRHVASFFSAGEAEAFMGNLRSEGLALLVRSVGASYRPWRLEPNRVHWVTHVIEGAELVRRCIDRLAGLPTREAGESLEDLATDKSLSSWWRQLRHARTMQAEARRNAVFRHPEVPEILDTLDDGKPANAADLAAVVLDVLTKLAREVRHGNTSDWRQYWKTGLEAPEHEDTCRDRLLSDLRRELKRFRIHAEPEGRYADEKRADIKVLGADAALPIEIKKSNHRHLWTALRTQLMGKYTPDPEAAGHGIYLVLWFGLEFAQPDQDGERPANGEQLRSALQADLSTEESRKVSVCVVDVSRSDG